MSNKIILWIDVAPLEFCIAHYFQKNNDYEMSAIIDITNKPKKFFQEQKLVNFKKILFIF